MDIQFKKMIGQTEFTFNVQAEGLKDFFEKVSVYEDIPVEGPNGEKDLKIAFRTTKQGHKYYSVICQSAKQEFKFGQATDNVSMFPKGWEPLYEAGEQQAAPAGGGLGAQQQQYIQNNQQAPAQNTQQAPAQNVGLGQQNVNQNIAPQQTYQQPATPAPAAQAPPQPTTQAQTNTAPAAPPAPAGGNPAVNDVLAKYGIGQ